jgi:hypothetical protein
MTSLSTFRACGEAGEARFAARLKRSYSLIQALGVLLILIDRWTIAIAALSMLAERGNVERIKVAEAIARYGVDTTAESPWTR